MSYLNVPVGVILDFGGATPPAGYLLCDGSAVSQSIYAALFAALGTGWNTGGEGAGNFRLPDLRGRTAIGAGAGSGLTARTLGQKVGAETHSHTVSAHNHHVVDLSAPGGFQTTYDGSGTSVNIAVTTIASGAGVGATLAGAGNVTSNLFSSNTSPGTDAQTIVQPSAVVNKIIKY